MDLLSLVGMVTKRRGDYFSQATSLAKKYKTQEKLEEVMAGEAKILVNALRLKQIKWSEYERSLIDKTLTSALAGVYMGSRKANPAKKLDKAWPIIVGNMLPPLKEFLDETKLAIDSQSLLVGNDSEEFREGIRSWLGLVSRVVRYIANPSYSFFQLGEYFTREEQGFKQMKRIAQKDQRVCIDCSKYEKQGWQPLGSLPMPGQECRCYDRCRCSVIYR